MKLAVAAVLTTALLAMTGCNKPIREARVPQVSTVHAG